jgi:hypothetical protein
MTEQMLKNDLASSPATRILEFRKFLVHQLGHL